MSEGFFDFHLGIQTTDVAFQYRKTIQILASLADSVLKFNSSPKQEIYFKKPLQKLKKNVLFDENIECKPAAVTDVRLFRSFRQVRIRIALMQVAVNHTGFLFPPVDLDRHGRRVARRACSPGLAYLRSPDKQ